ncbi:MAG: hypothetical protein M1834_001573 [Cirrosporium novae-zelandiae]|nr:MAG: hypothetical protein M1834_004090 [Cirrosporium novae-zelandiae]KAI9735558.1 MAG: hypothetical protein M1834_001573 [Cirrosporium novae-zelandiae]
MGQIFSNVWSAESSQSLISSQTSGSARVLSLHEWKAVAYSLAIAFEHDDVARYFVDAPDTTTWTAKEKWELHLKMLEYVVYAHLLKGLVVTAGDNYECVGLWMPPGRNMDDHLTILRSGMWRLRYQLSPEGRKRFFQEFLPLLHDTKEVVMGPRDNTSWYLVYIGTRPEARGKGLARQVIEFVTREADKHNQACYLESSNDINPIIYGKMGFNVARKVALSRSEKPVFMDIMIREPNSSSNGISRSPETTEKK